MLADSPCLLHGLWERTARTRGTPPARRTCVAGHRGTKEMVSPVSVGISIGTVSSVAHLRQSWQSPSGPTGQVLVESRRKLA